MIRIYTKGILNICRKFHSSPFNSCQDISVEAKNVSLVVMVEEKSEHHQSQKHFLVFRPIRYFLHTHNSNINLIWCFTLAMFLSSCLFFCREQFLFYSLLLVEIQEMQIIACSEGEWMAAMSHHGHQIANWPHYIWINPRWGGCNGRSREAMNIQNTLCGPFHLHSQHMVQFQLNWLVVAPFVLPSPWDEVAGIIEDLTCCTATPSVKYLGTCSPPSLAFTNTL